VADHDSNAFLDPILARSVSSPDWLFGAFYDSDAWREVSLIQFMDRSRDYRAVLQDAAVASGDVVLIILEHGFEAHCAFFGAMLLGAVPSFMPYPNGKQDAVLYWKHHRATFARLRPKAIIVFQDLWQPIASECAGLDALILSPASVRGRPDAARSLAVPKSGAVALLQHSSGTTGLKKGVQLSYQAIAEQLRAYSQALHLDETPSPRVASWLPLYHDMGLVSSFLLPLWWGIPIIGVDPFEWVRSPGLLLEGIQKYHCTHCWIPNFALLQLSNRATRPGAWDLSTMRAWICCSEPCKPEAFDRFLAAFESSGVRSSQLQACYAMAETVFAITQTAVGSAPRRLVVDREQLQSRRTIGPALSGQSQVILISNGTPVPGCSVRILREEAFVGELILGEICVQATYLFTGYFQNPEATESAFSQGWLRTGDLGFIDEGELFIVGRVKDVIIVNGKNLFAHDIEAAVSRVQGVKPGRAVAFGEYSEQWGSEQLTVAAEALTGFDNAALTRNINAAVVEEVGVGCARVLLVPVGTLIKTTSGKMNRAENAARLVSTPPKS
jgi:acyl-CoA synthetase (AMP-forming)/AMP-acid ligase II